MADLNIIDQFMSDFTRYIDSGFGLLGGDVHFLTVTLIAIDITLAGLFWAMGGEDNVIGKLIRKVLYVGTFAFIINSYSSLSDIIFRSFEQAGLTAGGSTMSAADLLKPGKLAGTGFSAAWPLLQQVSKLMGFTSFFDNYLTIAVLVIAWVIVILAFFILAVQLFVTILEFKLTSLAGFILVPFALWNRTNFLAERVLGNVVTSGIKVMVLAIIVGIGSTYFSQFTSSLQGQDPDIGQAMSLVLASLALLGLGIFGSGIATGLVAGAPQLGAGSVMAIGMLVGGGMAAGGAGALGAARAVGGAGLNAVRAGASMGKAAAGAYRTGQQDAGASTVSAGLAGVYNAARAAAGTATKQAAGEEKPADSEAPAGGAPGGGPSAPAGKGPETQQDQASDEAAPPWAKALESAQAARNRRQNAIHALQSGDHGGSGANPDIEEKE
ncbi:P-type conjugative transfer protein TrbL [Novosphingobium terrae]|uniref:P-type conjugative transfer protein TrbL n=1 Tax=Novosphingobium terrae TaxID=2726189 RepID=UPI00197E2625|nr:P-type conjugative transfer protein TrbL [Novosphingobium terrae]